MSIFKNPGRNVLRYFFPNWFGTTHGCHKSEYDSYTSPGLFSNEWTNDWEYAKAQEDIHKQIPCDPHIQPKGRLDILHFNSRVTYRQGQGVLQGIRLGTTGGTAVNFQWQGSKRSNGGQYITQDHGCKITCFDVDSTSPSIKCFERDITTGEDGDTLWEIFDLTRFSWMPQYPAVAEAGPQYYDWKSSRDEDFVQDPIFWTQADGFYTLTQWNISKPHDGRFMLHSLVAFEWGDVGESIFTDPVPDFNQHVTGTKNVFIFYYVEIRSMEDGSLLSSGLIDTRPLYESGEFGEGVLDYAFTSQYNMVFNGAHSPHAEAFTPVSDTEFLYRNYDMWRVTDPYPARIFQRYELGTDSLDSFQAAYIIADSPPDPITESNYYSALNWYTPTIFGTDEIINHVFGDDGYIYALAYTPNDDVNLDGYFGGFLGFYQDVITDIRFLKIDPDTLISELIQDNQSSRLLRLQHDADVPVALLYQQDKIYGVYYTSWVRYDLGTDEEFVFSNIAAGFHFVNKDWKYAGFQYDDDPTHVRTYYADWHIGQAWFISNYVSWQGDWQQRWMDYPRHILIDTFEGGTDTEDEDYTLCDDPDHCITCNDMTCLEGEPCFCLEGAAGICTGGVCDCCLGGSDCDPCECPGGWRGVCTPQGCDCTGDGECTGCGNEDYSPCKCLNNCTGFCLDGKCVSCCGGVCVGDDGIPYPEGYPCPCDDDPEGGPYTGICKNGDCTGCGDTPDGGCEEPLSDGKPCICKDGFPGECRGGRCRNRQGADCRCPYCGGGGGTPRCRDREGLPCECRDGTPGTCNNGKCIDTNGEDCCPGCTDPGDPGDCGDKAEGEGCTCEDGSPGECHNGKCLDENGDECCEGCGDGDDPWCDECDAECNGGIGDKPDGEPCECCDGSTSTCLNGECDCPCKASNTGDECTDADGCTGTCQGGCCQTGNPCECFPTATTNTPVANGGSYCIDHSAADCPFEDGTEVWPTGYLSYACHVACSEACDQDGRSPEMTLTVAGDCEFCSGPAAEKLDDGGVEARTYIGACLRCIANVKIVGCWTETVTTSCYGSGDDCTIEDEFQYGGNCL